MQKYRSNAESVIYDVKTEEASVSDFDKLLENDANDDNDDNRIGPITATVSPPIKAVKKKTVRASLPMKFKITKVILIKKIAKRKLIKLYHELVTFHFFVSFSKTIQIPNYNHFHKFMITLCSKQKKQKNNFKDKKKNCNFNR